MKPSLAKSGKVPPGYLRKSDAAAYLGGIAPRTLQEWVRQRIVPSIPVTRKVVLFRVSDLDEAMKRLERKARAAG